MTSVASTGVDFATCPSLSERQRADAGTGKTWVPGSYCHGRGCTANDAPSQAVAGCPHFYKTPSEHSYGNAGCYADSGCLLFQSSSDEVDLNALQMGNYSIFQGGHLCRYSQGGMEGRSGCNGEGEEPRINAGGLVHLGAPGGRPFHSDSQGRYTTGWEHESYEADLLDFTPIGQAMNFFSEDGDAGQNTNDYGAVCMKDDTAYFRTDPVTGLEWTIRGAEDAHKNICCGFASNHTPVLEYCHPDYCHSTGANDKISPKCREYLTDYCDSSRRNFQNYRCRLPGDVRAEERASSDDGGSLIHTAQGARNSISLTSADYRRIGNKHCRKQDFTPGSQYYDVCKRWCSRNIETCHPKITAYCEETYDNAILDMDGGASGALGDSGIAELNYESNEGERTHISPVPDTNATRQMRESKDICACNWPQGFYNKTRDNLQNVFNIPDSKLPGGRKCLYKPCQTAAIRWKREISAPECPPDTLVSCVQELDVNIESVDVTGGANFAFDPQQRMECGIRAETSTTNIDSSATSTTSSDGGEEEDFDLSTIFENEEYRPYLMWGGGALFLIIVALIFAISNQ